MSVGAGSKVEYAGGRVDRYPHIAQDYLLARFSPPLCFLPQHFRECGCFLPVTGCKSSLYLLSLHYRHDRLADKNLGSRCSLTLRHLWPSSPTFRTATVAQHLALGALHRCSQAGTFESQNLAVARAAGRLDDTRAGRCRLQHHESLLFRSRIRRMGEATVTSVSTSLFQSPERKLQRSAEYDRSQRRSKTKSQWSYDSWRHQRR